MMKQLMWGVLSVMMLGACSSTSENEPAYSQEEYLRMSELPGEFTAEQILNGEYQWPPSPERNMNTVSSPYFEPQIFGEAPAPGVHPRILFSPEDIAGIQRRSKETETGRLALKTLRSFQKKSLLTENTSSYNIYKSLSEGQVDKARVMLDDYNSAGISDGVSWHHRPQFPYILLLETFDCLISGDDVKGQEIAVVVSNLGKIYQQQLSEMDQAFAQNKTLSNGGTVDANALKPNAQLNSDIWRSGRRKAIGNDDPYFALMYDFAYNWMNEDQQGICRKALTDYIKGKTAMGSHMPHHFRHWNWVAVGSGLLMSSLATEGEEGNDPRVYEHQKEIQTDYLKYGWSDNGMSKEAIGYTQFGLTWLTPSLVAMARRGHNLWNQERWYNSLKWYAHSLQADGERFLSHGDGGQAGPTIQTMLIWKRAYPNDPLVNYLLDRVIASWATGGDKLDGGRGQLIYQLIFAGDPLPNDYTNGATLGLKNTFFDDERKSLLTRSAWSEKDDVLLQFECREDQVSPSHQHSDRGSFTLSGAGRLWAIDRFRAVESRHHNCVTIDGKGQGYVPPNGKWLSLADNANATFGAVDAKYAYDWYWDGVLSGYADKSQDRRYFKRWEHFQQQADKYMEEHPDFDWRANIDRSPVLEAFYNGFESGDPRVWDEYGRPVRIAHNPVEKAFRSCGLVRGNHSYALVVDDIKKDDQERTYEWNMMVDNDVNLASLKLDELLLCGNKTYTAGAWPGPKTGESVLLVKVLNRTIPEDVFTNPCIRLETIEYKEARGWPQGRSFGMAKRLVIPSYSTSPDFKILLFPHRQGQEKPVCTWNEEHTQVVVAWSDQKDVIDFSTTKEGRTTYTITRDHQVIVEI